jgi:hypothetical protein
LNKKCHQIWWKIRKFILDLSVELRGHIQRFKENKQKTIIYKTLHRKLKIEQHEHHKNKQWSTKHYTEN